LEKEKEALFQDLLKRSSVEVVSVSRRVANLAREIRDILHSENIKIAVPDSIHLATAIHYKASALHTYDGCGKRPKNTDLLKLKTPVIGKYEVKICKPEPPPQEERPSEAKPVEGLVTLNLFEFAERELAGKEEPAGED
jgi:hypothetical protein